MIEPTAPPARYLPFMSGRYEVKPALRALGADLGNADADARPFQIDCEYHRYLRAKRGAAGRWLTRDLSEALSNRAVELIAGRLVSDYPQWFQRTGRRLHARLTGEIMDLDAPDVLWRLGLEIQEDFAITQVDGERNWLAALHVCIPSRWTPQEKIGRPFSSIHQVVPGMAPIIARQTQYVTQMIEAEQGLVRFVFGLQTDNCLANFPDRPQPPFDPEHPTAFVRVERQVILGMPEVHASLFLIRPYLMNIDSLTLQERCALALAIESMSPPTLAYKGLTTWHIPLTRWLRAV